MAIEIRANYGNFNHMKRRFFVQSLGAVAVSPPLPLSGMASKAVTTPTAMNAGYTPFMQANALAILRNNENLSYIEFLSKTGLNPAQGEAMLKRFAKLGWASPNGIAGIQAIKPQWMKDFASAQNAVSARADRPHQFRPNMENATDETPKFSSINRCCEPDALDPITSESHGATSDDDGEREL